MVLPPELVFASPFILEIFKPALSKVFPGMWELAKGAMRRKSIEGVVDILEPSDTVSIVDDRSSVAIDRLERAASDPAFQYQRELAAAAVNSVEGEVILPDLTIASRIFQGAEFERPGSPIWQLWRKLLARACDKDRVGEAHPAFPSIISALSLDEVLLIHTLMQVERSARASGVLNDYSAKELGLAFPQLVMAYNAHLESLGLCRVISTANYVGAVGRAMRVDGIPVSELSAFGRIFADAVVAPDGGES